MIDVSKLLPETMPITMRLEPSMSLEQPRAGDALRQFRGNTTVIEVRSITVPLASTWGIQFRDSKLSWTVNFIFPKNGPTIRLAEKNYIPDEIQFATKPQIALELIDRALGNGIRVSAWTFDEFYGRDSKFLDGLDSRKQAYVAEIPSDMHVWTTKPSVIRKAPAKKSKGRPRGIPRTKRQPPACEVRNLLTYSPKFQQQSWRLYRIKDTERGPEVWEVKWLLVWRKTETKLPSTQQTLIVARSTRTDEIKYFISNQIVG